MNKSQLLGLAGLSLVALGTAAAEIESKFHAGYSTDYVFRGVNQNNFVGSDSGLFEAGLDFSGAADCGFDWNAGIWLADFGNDAEQRNFYGSVAKSFSVVKLELGAIRYDRDFFVDDTTELFLGASTEFNGIGLSGRVYYDVDANDGATYGELIAGKTFELAAEAQLNVSVHYATTLADYDAANYYSYGVRVTASKTITEGLVGNVYIAGEITEGHDLDNDDLFGGVSLVYTF